MRYWWVEYHQGRFIVGEENRHSHLETPTLTQSTSARSVSPQSHNALPNHGLFQPQLKTPLGRPPYSSGSTFDPRSTPSYKTKQNQTEEEEDVYIWSATPHNPRVPRLRVCQRTRLPSVLSHDFLLICTVGWWSWRIWCGEGVEGELTATRALAYSCCGSVCGQVYWAKMCLLGWVHACSSLHYAWWAGEGEGKDGEGGPLIALWLRIIAAKIMGVSVFSREFTERVPWF